MSGEGGKEFGSIGRLRQAIAAIEQQHTNGESTRVRNLLEPIGNEASVLAATLIVLPFLSPISMGPLTAPASLIIALLALQFLLMRKGSLLPQRLLDLPIAPGVWRAMDSVLSRVERAMVRFSRRRFLPLVEGQGGRVICALGIIGGATLLAIPIPFLPLTNTLPSLGILCLSFGWMEKDGLLTIVGIVALLLTLVVFAALGFAIVYFGVEAVQAAWPF